MVKTASDSDSSASNLVEPKYKGVRLRKWGKYVSEIRLPNCRDRIWLGSYDSAEKAARAFDAALFCLRGPHAKFNFPGNLPEIPDRQGLSPAQIQAVAQNYGNSCAGPCGPGNNDRPQMGLAGGEVGRFRGGELLEDVLPSSNREGAGQVDSIDWSFLDVLDSDAGRRLSDFGLFHEPGDMYFPPHFQDISDEGGNNGGEEYGNGGNVQSFLWNF